MAANKLAAKANAGKNTNGRLQRHSALFLAFALVFALASVIIVSSPAHSLTTSNPRPTIRVVYDEDVTLLNYTLKRTNAAYFIPLALVSSSANRTFSIRPAIDLVEGDYDFTSRAADFLGNIGTTLETFTVNYSFVVELVIPTYGRAQNTTFPLVFSSSQNATCRYDFTVPKPFNLYRNFDYTGSTLHGLNQFSLSTPGFNGIVFVICNNTFGQLFGNNGEFMFSLSQDNTPPAITSLTANPNPVSQCVMINPPACTIYTTLTAETSEPTNCRYDPDFQEYSQMRNFFSEAGEFAGVHQVNLTFNQEGDHNYYVACEDRSWPAYTTPTRSIVINVNTSIPLQITGTAPSGYTSQQTVDLEAVTNKVSDCRFYTASGLFIGQALGGTVHRLPYQVAGNGTFIIDVNCSTLSERTTGRISFISDRTAPIFDYVNDSSPHADPTRTNDLSRLRVRFLAHDDQSGIMRYMYRVENSSGLPVSDWEEGEDETWNIADGLDLHNGTYKFRVNATNNAGLSTTSLSDGIIVDTSYQPYVAPSCHDGIKNQNEVGVDCGGVCTAKCSNGDTCIQNSDCISGVCNSSNKICVANPCDNNLLDTWHRETDIDCGGSYCTAQNLTCAIGKNCLVNSDCSSNYCNGQKKCALPSCFDNERNGQETGIDCGGSCAALCENGEGCRVNSDCESNYCRNGVCGFDPDDIDGDGIRNEQDPDNDGDGDDNWDDPDDDNDGYCDTGNSPLNSPSICTGNDDDDDGDGYRKDQLDKDPDNDWDQDGIDNNHDDDIDGDGILNENDPDDDNDSLCDESESVMNEPLVCTGEDDDDDNDGVLDVDEDTDGDGLPDWWEDLNGLDKYTDDADKQDPITGLTYRELYRKEVESQGQQVVPGGQLDELEGFDWFTWLWIFLLIILLGGGGYYAYIKYFKPKPVKPAALPPGMARPGMRPGQPLRPGMPQQGMRPGMRPGQPLRPMVQQKPLSPAVRAALEKKRQEREQKRQNVFGAFGEGKKEGQLLPLRPEKPAEGKPGAEAQPEAGKKPLPAKPSKEWLDLDELKDGEKPVKEEAAGQLPEAGKEAPKGIFDQLAELAGISKPQKPVQDASKPKPQEDSAAEKKATVAKSGEDEPAVIKELRQKASRPSAKNMGRKGRKGVKK